MTEYLGDKEKAEKAAKERGTTIEPVRSFGVFKIVNGEPVCQGIWFEDDPHLPCERYDKCEIAIVEGPLYYRVGPGP
jgi:hypothetical protein